MQRSRASENPWEGGRHNKPLVPAAYLGQGGSLAVLPAPPACPHCRAPPKCHHGMGTLPGVLGGSHGAPWGGGATLSPPPGSGVHPGDLILGISSRGAPAAASMPASPAPCRDPCPSSASRFGAKSSGRGVLLPPAPAAASQGCSREGWKDESHLCPFAKLSPENPWLMPSLKVVQQGIPGTPRGTGEPQGWRGGFEG